MATEAPEALPLGEQTRVDKIVEYGVLDGAAFPELRALVEIAAEVAQVPRAAIDIVTADQQHHVAAVGFTGFVCEREDSLCHQVLDEPEAVVVADASQDARFADNPFVTGRFASVRFYASHQLRTPEGHVIGALCVFDDVPRVITIEQQHSLAGLASRAVDMLELHLRSRQLTETVAELERTRDELERSNDHLSAFAGQVSHDLRTPLTSMSMSLRMIADHVEESPALADDADLAFLTQRAIRGADRMTAMVHDLLGFAVLGGPQQHETVDLAACAAQVLTDLDAVLVHVDVQVDELPVVVGNPTQLRAVLQNLVSNAAKFTRVGERGRVHVTSRRTDGAWRVEVADAGPGVPLALRQQVFENLARVDHSVQGSGIGLATCRRVIEAHGGRIGLDDSPYGGTTAWFELPD